MLAIGVDVHVGFSIAGITGTIGAIGVLGLGASCLPPRPGLCTLAVLRSSVGITVDVFVERQVGGVGPFVRTVVNAAVVVVAGVPLVVVLGANAFAAGDVVRFGVAKVVGVSPTTTDLQIELELTYS